MITKIAIAQTPDDSHRMRFDTNATVWPPNGSYGGTDDYIWIEPERSKFDYGIGLRYYLAVALLRFDTSRLSRMKIASATLDLWVDWGTAGSTLNVEYYPYDGATVDSHWTTTISSTAGSYAAGGGGTLGVIQIPLTNPENNFNKTGYTGFRLHCQIGAEPPTVDNIWYIASRDHGTYPPPALTVNYDVQTKISAPTMAGSW